MSENLSGILNVYKPQGLTSHAVVSRVRKFYGVKRVGHAGTLDPMACGVLPVLVGSAASVQELVMEHDKTYKAGVLFGVTTDTGDVTGKVLDTKTPAFDSAALNETLTRFTGEIDQVPPMYSALKVEGQKLYELARRGETVERKARKVTVYGIRLITPFDGKRCDMEVDCSKGTYIRTLAEDIGNALGCGACLDSLERTVCGVYRAADAVTVETLEKLYQNGDTSALAGFLQSAEALFADCPVVRLAPFYEKLARNGAEIYLKRARIPERLFEHGRLCRLYKENGGFYAVAELGDYPDGAAVKIKYRF